MDNDTILDVMLAVAEQLEDQDQREDALHWLADKLHAFEQQGNQQELAESEKTDTLGRHQCYDDSSGKHVACRKGDDGTKQERSAMQDNSTGNVAKAGSGSKRISVSSVAEHANATIADSPYSYHGVRIISRNPTTDEQDEVEEGDILPNSYQWEDDETTGEELGGTSTYAIHQELKPEEIEEFLRGYAHLGSQLVLVGSDDKLHGRDRREYLLKDPEVLAVFNLSELDQ